MPISTKRIDAMRLATCLVGLCFLSFAAPAANAQGEAGPMVGEIKVFAGSFAPRGWKLCNGQELSKDDAPALFALLGNVYGGDGKNTYSVPDLTGRAPVQVGKGAGIDGGKLGSTSSRKALKVLEESKLEKVTTQPTLGMNYIICAKGTVPHEHSNEIGGMAGEVRMFAGKFAPKGWGFCKGQLVHISAFKELHSRIGTLYGGDGKYSFALPDLRGRIPAGVDRLGEDFKLGSVKDGVIVSVSKKDNSANTTVEHTLGLNFIICLASSRRVGQPMLAEVKMFAGSVVDKHKAWESCEGQMLDIRDNAALFSLFGTTYGGNGRNNFSLPDLKGRTPIHVGQGEGLEPVVLGGKGDGKTFNVSKTVAEQAEYGTSKTRPTLGLTFMIATKGSYPVR